MAHKIIYNIINLQNALYLIKCQYCKVFLYRERLDEGLNFKKDLIFIKKIKIHQS